MYQQEQQYIFSASDLITYMNSEFASWMDRFELDYPERVKDIDKVCDPLLSLLAEKGHQHEKHFLNVLKEEYGFQNVVEIDAPRHQAYAATIEAMEKGVEVIFQAYLKRDSFAGFADFLVKREGTSNLGNYYYESWDTKLSKTSRPYFLIQLCCYNWMLEEIQGIRPEEAVVVLGDGTRERNRLNAEFCFFENLKSRFLKAQSSFNGIDGDRPDPALFSSFGNWSKFAQTLMETTESLAIVANIRKSQIKKLYDAGVQSMSQLAHTNYEHITGISKDSFLKLKDQANIQLRSRHLSAPQYEVINSDQGKGLSSLPEKSSLDVFFDIEGHPLIDGGLEYLWGASYVGHDLVHAGKKYGFQDWWAHTQKHEKQAFEGFIDWVYERWQRDPSMHIYHYASYEITAVNKISSREHTREEELSELLSNGVFIDLYKIVRNGLLIGEPKYSIKNVEHLYRDKRNTEVATGGESVVFYEQWREVGGVEDWLQLPDGHSLWTKNPSQFDWKKWQILKEIRDYNIDDCESTLELVEWLRSLKQQHNIKTFVEEIKPELEKNEQQLANKQKREELAERKQDLLEIFNSNPVLQNDPTSELLISLLYFHERENKPKTWAYYERLAKTEEELFDDDTVLCSLNLVNSDYEEGKISYTAAFDTSQAYRKDKFSTAKVNGLNIVANKIVINDLGDNSGKVNFQVDLKYEKFLPQGSFNLLGQDPYINTSNLEIRLCEITEHFFKTKNLKGALSDILMRSKPKLGSMSQRLPVNRTLYPDDENYLEAIIKLVNNMKETCLCIQGPPGAGKTYTAKQIISNLVANGKRIGIISNSHAAIMNLLESLPALLPQANLVKVGGNYTNLKAFRIDYPEESFPNLTYRPSMNFTKKAPCSSFSVIGATVYGYANEAIKADPLDYIFVDEASQVSLANLVAISGSAINFILMGDQMQLEQPIQGSHPGNSGLSVLEFLLRGHDVIPDDRGLFLEQTYRMHPDICRPLSEIVYEGRLKSAPKTENQKIHVPNSGRITKSSGVLSVLISHQGNTQSSIEEVRVIQELIDELLKGTYTDTDRFTAPITLNDILVVAPYNMQVNLLIDNLPKHIKIGTIDKFQGQEAPIVIVSMTTSDVAEASRGMDFVFDVNRLNVAISRAKALAIVVANETIHHCNITSLEQMKKVGFYSRLITS